MTFAVCDIGSNTIKMKIYSYSDTLKEEYSEVCNAKLISYIKDRVLSKEGTQLLCDTVARFKSRAELLNVKDFYAFATASLRRIDSFDEVAKTVLKETGVKIDLVSGDDEAYFSFVGVKSSMDAFPNDCIMLDMGGGSTEIVVVKDGEKNESHSMNFGSLSLFLECQSFNDMQNFALSRLDECIKDRKNTDYAILVGGTALAINKIYKHCFSEENDFSMNIEKLSALYSFLTTNEKERQALLEKLVPERITTVVPGMAAFVAIFNDFGVKNIFVSTKGIREGYALERIIKNTEKN
ncbi:MAG: hypothetical protein IKU45_03060 [Clostridia bacterium]|nr:hypothetical protein [Clostridia bacterium]